MTEDDFRCAIAPDNWTARAAFADWLAEQGRDDEAHGQRWMAKHGKRPEHRTMYHGPPPRRVPAQYQWAWYRGFRDEVLYYRGIVKPPKHSLLPSPIFMMLGGKFSYRDHAFFPSESAAEAALAAALKALLEAIKA